ncbi:transmembrane protein 269 isoform X2 [Takifugu flavidus]|uniref:transmembrane protein 269 isoform X2 n=1 Tax=Takifugu flavidus TaxID=433684 RepID=UPI0025440068|nr:transmembrane protein 269 isoform X2 [Takifugu flavidus]
MWVGEAIGVISGGIFQRIDLGFKRTRCSLLLFSCELTVMILLTPSSALFQCTNKLFLTDRTTRQQIKEFARKNAANALSVANMLMGMASILSSLNGHHHAACWLVLIGYLLDLADGAVARRLNACSALGAKLDDFADFTTFGIATSLLFRTPDLFDNILCMFYVLSVFVRLCFFSSGIPFMYRGLPCIYSSAILSSASLLSGGNLALLRVLAMSMIIFMIRQTFYPHDRVLESQAWKKVVYAGDDVVLLASSARDLQRSLDRFASAREAAGMEISTSKSEAMVLNRKKVECLLRVKEEILPQVEEFKYLGVLFTSEGRMEREIDRRIGAASAVMRTLHRSIFVPTLTYGHELWVMTERTRSRVQAAEMSFLRRVAGLSLRDRVRSSAIREELGVEPLLLRVERSQMGWLGHLVRMPPGRLPGEVFRACPSGRRPPGRPRTRWRDYVSRLVWEHLGIPRMSWKK